MCFLCHILPCKTICMAKSTFETKCFSMLEKVKSYKFWKISGAYAQGQHFPTEWLSNLHDLTFQLIPVKKDFKLLVFNRMTFKQKKHCIKVHFISCNKFSLTQQTGWQVHLGLNGRMMAPFRLFTLGLKLSESSNA